MEQINVDQAAPSEAPAAQEVAPVVSNGPDVAIPQVEKPSEPVAEPPVAKPIEAEEKPDEVAVELKKEEAQPTLEAPPSEPVAPEALAAPAQEAAPSAKEPPSDDVLIARLGEVLKTVDLGVMTGKMASIYHLGSYKH
jgi:hypothetical protein